MAEIWISINYQVFQSRFYKLKLFIEHISWCEKPIWYHFSHPRLQTCHPPATCQSGSTSDEQRGWEKPYGWNISRAKTTTDVDFFCLSVCWLHRERAHAGRSPCCHEHCAVKIFKLLPSRVIKMKGEMPKEMLITTPEWSTTQWAWTVHLGRHSNAIPVQNVPWCGRQENFECGGTRGSERWKAKTSPNTITR